MVGIGHLLAEAEMRKEALTPGTWKAIGLGTGSAALAGGYVLHGRHYGKQKAERDYAAAPPDKDDLRPNWRTRDQWLAGSIGRKAYRRRLHDLYEANGQ